MFYAFFECFRFSYLLFDRCDRSLTRLLMDQIKSIENGFVVTINAFITHSSRFCCNILLKQWYCTEMMQQDFMEMEGSKRGSV